LKDALEVYALRMGRKSGKEVVAQGVSMGDAMAESIRKVFFGKSNVLLDDLKSHSSYFQGI
jgi:hypothetical protein